MYSSAPQTCHYYNNNSKHDTSSYQSLGRCTSDNNNPITSEAAPSSWNPHLEHDYNLGSPTPSTSPSFQLPQQQQYSSITAPPTSTPYVLSHPPSHHHQPDSLVSPITPTTPSSAATPLVPSYGYGLSHRGFFPRPKLTTTLWEDERTVCFQVDANGICVARREDNDMINGTKLLNVAGMSRGKRDGILKNEKGRVVVKVGAMHLKGVWITFDRAKTLSAQFKIQDILYPLFVDNPQTFLYSHPMSSPMSRLGSFRPFCPPSWDRTLPSAATSPASPSINHHHHHNHHHSPPSDSHYDTATPAPFGYRSGGPLFDPHSSSYGNEVNAGHHSSGNNVLSMEYRSGGNTSDTLSNQVDSSSSTTSHGPSSSTYYNDLLDPNHRSNDMPFYNHAAENNNTEKLGISTASSPNRSLLDNHDSLMDTKRSSSGTTLQPSSAFQTIDTTTFHHPQPVYMDTNSRGDYHPNSHPLYLDNPAPSTKGSSILDGLAENSLLSYADHTNSSRRDTLVHTRAVQRHHPYANSPKLSSDLSYPPLKKLNSSSRLGSSGRPLAKEIDDLSVKNEADHSSRPW